MQEVCGARPTPGRERPARLRYGKEGIDTRLTFTLQGQTRDSTQCKPRSAIGDVIATQASQPSDGYDSVLGSTWQRRFQFTNR